MNVVALVLAVLLGTPFSAAAESSDRAVWALIGQVVASAVTQPFGALFSRCSTSICGSASGRRPGRYLVPMPLTFGVTVLPDPPYQRLIELLQLAERHGFEYGWTYDSHVLWQESTPTLALAAAATERIKLGHMVTNPGTREPTVLASAYATLQDISDGRMVMGIGRGDSARRYINQQPVRVGQVRGGPAG